MCSETYRHTGRVHRLAGHFPRTIDAGILTRDMPAPGLESLRVRINRGGPDARNSFKTARKRSISKSNKSDWLGCELIRNKARVEGPSGHQDLYDHGSRIGSSM